MKQRRIIVISMIMFIVIILAILDFFSKPFEIHGEEVEIDFAYEDTKISGSLYKPQGKKRFPVVLFIHGDGASNRNNHQKYALLFNAFLEKGIGCYSYDKQGIGKSEGNWLMQTMGDRALESNAAIDVLRQLDEVSDVGVIALSQGGWVIAEIAMTDHQSSFFILIGGAIDWLEQHYYYERIWLADSGYSEKEKKKYLEYSKVIDDLIIKGDYNVYLEVASASHFDDEPMNEDRFIFAHKNMDANMVEGMKQMNEPFLGLFGEKDINVDTKESADVLVGIFEEAKKTNYEIIIYEDANHVLLKSRYEPRYANGLTQIEMFLNGKAIFVEGSLNKLGDWVLEQYDN